MTEKHLYIIAFFWLTLYVIGFAIHLFQIKLDKKISNKKYQLTGLKQISKLNFPIHLLLISIVTLILGLIASSMLLKKIYIPGILGLFIIICAIVIGYYSIVAILLHIQYYRLEKNREILFDTVKKEIIIKYTNKNVIGVY